jgi:hypothetical protein
MRAWIFFFTMLVVSLFFVTAFSQSGSSEDLLVPNLSQADAERLVLIHSDEEAKAFFSTHLREAFGLKSIMPDTSRLSNKSKTSQASAPSLEWTDIGGRLTSEFARCSNKHMNSARGCLPATHIPNSTEP